MSAVYRSGLMCRQVMGKGLISGFVGSLAMTGYYGVKQFGYTYVRNRILRNAR